MTIPEPVVIVKEALAKGELDKLLLGTAEYCYLPKWSSTPGNTDLTVLLDTLYKMATDNNKYENLQRLLLTAVDNIVTKYEGIDPVISILFKEVYNKINNEITFELPLDVIASKLRTTIIHFHDLLLDDKTEGGIGFHDGRYGDIKRMNNIILEYNGPSII
jgi:hypothetical protein